jgi:hypothetical protein
MQRRFPKLALLIALCALTAPAAWAGNAKVQVCHIPPGNPSNFHTITISENALQAHLGHGDIAGTCFAHCDTLCSDGNPCTIDACDANEQCRTTHPPVNCDDSNPCTVDSCSPATGCVNKPKTCTDSNLCTVDACDPLTGSCVFPPVSCSEGESCNPADGSCQSLDFCSPNPCLNDGVCTNGAAGHTCACAPGYSGDNCQIAIDFCAGITCPLPDQCHVQGVCSAGICSNPTKPDGTVCVGPPGSINPTCGNGVCLYSEDI